VDTLRSEGPFTVFAPTDAAFAKLPPDALQALLADQPRLQRLLLYHVVPGRVTASPWRFCRQSKRQLARLEQGGGTPNKPESRRNPEEFEVVMEQAKVFFAGQKEIGGGSMTYGDAW
jgi:hypothetical protein